MKRVLGTSVAMLLVVSGCATIRRHDAASTEQMLAAAGFRMQPADSPERLAALNAMPRQKLVARTTDPKGPADARVVYTYADPDNCHCVYVGGPKEYSAFERLRVEKQMAIESEQASMDWPWWGPWCWSAAPDWCWGLGPAK